jgi:glycosyltransferase involved in cell wall biosynthesis
MSPTPVTIANHRVVHISFGLDVGGQEKLLVEFARHADRARFDLMFVSLGGRGELANDLESHGWRVVALEQPHGLKPGLSCRLARLFHDERPSVVHTHDGRSLLYAAPAVRLARVPLFVHTCHGLIPRGTRRQEALVSLVSRLADRWVCVSEDVRLQSRLLGIRDKLMCTILNGIDLTRFGYTGPAPEGPVVTVSRLGRAKDIPTLVRAVELARQQAPDIKVEVAGGGPCLDELLDLAASLNLSGHVRFLGEVHDVPAVLARASMFVLPSLAEGLPLTVLEAMARGLPVIATRVGGLPELVISGETGLLVPPADPAALAAAILSLWGDPARRMAMGQAARERIERFFDIRRMVADYEALYHELGLPAASEPVSPETNGMIHTRREAQVR